jgi:regulator of sigma E protease
LPYRPKIEPVVDQLVPDGAANRQGMQKGDKIIAIDGVKTPDWFDVVDIVQKSPEKLLKIDVERQGKILQLQVMPQGKRDNMGNVTGMLGVQTKSATLLFLANISKLFNIHLYKRSEKRYKRQVKFPV